jgi:hypothetical protein
MNDISIDDAIELAHKYMTDATIGIELEVLDPLQMESTVIRQANAKGVKIVSRNYTHEVMKVWKFVDDGSIHGRELVSPPLKPQTMFLELRIILDILLANGYKVDRSCSVHCHHDASKYTNKRLRYFLNHVVKNEVNFDCLVSSSRRDGRWCRSMKSELDCLVQSLDSSEMYRCNEWGIHQSPNGVHIGSNGRGNARYRKWNFHSFSAYKTLECRQHQGSLDFSKIVLWLALTQNMVTRCKTKVNYTKGWDNPMCNLLISLGFAKRSGKAIKPLCPLAKWVCESVVARMEYFNFNDRLPELDLTPEHLEQDDDQIWVLGCGWTDKAKFVECFPSMYRELGY